MTMRTKLLYSILMVLLVIPLTPGCSKKNKSNDQAGIDSLNTSNEPFLQDTLKAVTLYGPTSYFDYRGEPMGIDYENVKRFAQDEGMALQIITLNNLHQLIEALKNGEADVAAYPIPLIAEFQDEVLHAGHKEITTQVLAQKKSDNVLSDVTELIGKDIYVEKDSKYLYRLENLNEELGGGINIKPIENDTIDAEDLLKWVAQGKIDYTVVDSDLAGIYKTALPNLDTSLKLSAEQAASWAVSKKNKTLADKIDKWDNRTHTSDFVKDIYMKYYETALNDEFDSNLSYFKERNLNKGQSVSEYDSYFKKHASTAGYDWKLLAAIAYCESRYNSNVTSPFGARGLMQVMPASARAMGVDPATLGSPDSNVLAASKIIQKLDESLKNKVTDPEERLKFVVAAYNSGLGHINDAIALASKLGLNPQKWTGSVSVAALMKSRPEYYNDPVVKNGYFRGRETVNFVDHVSSIYRYLKQNMPA